MLSHTCTFESVEFIVLILIIFYFLVYFFKLNQLESLDEGIPKVAPVVSYIAPKIMYI